MTCVALVGALALGAGSGWTQDQPHGDAHKGATVTLSDAAAKAIAAAFPKATVGKVSLAGRGDNKVFSVPLTEGDKTCAAQVTDAGAIVSVRTPVGDDLSTLPKAVTAAVDLASAGAKITSAARVELRADPKTGTAFDKVKINYDVRFTSKDGVKSTMEVAEDGTVIRPPKAPKTTEDKPAAPKS
jgi:hypothetical protein